MRHCIGCNTRPADPKKDKNGIWTITCKACKTLVKARLPEKFTLDPEYVVRKMWNSMNHN